jgi:Leucine-rich repeat (LRR) protein
MFVGCSGSTAHPQMGSADDAGDAQTQGGAAGQDAGEGGATMLSAAGAAESGDGGDGGDGAARGPGGAPEVGAAGESAEAGAAGMPGRTQAVACPSIGDPVLDAAVRAALGLPSGPISLQAALRLGSLSTANAGVQSLAGLQCFSALTTLAVTGDPISDLTPLVALKNLTRLDLTADQVRDVTPLAELGALQVLTLDSNPLTDATPLVGLSTLHSLELNFTKVTDLSRFSSFGAQCEVGLSGTGLSDVTPLAGLTNLTGLDVSGNQVSDVLSLQGLTGLRYLQLVGNPLTNLAPISGLTHITDFSAGPNISDWQDVRSLTGVETLLISPGTVAVDFSVLAELPRLDDLTVQRVSQRQNYVPLGSLRGLEHLVLEDDVTLTDISFLSQNTNLVSLDILGAGVADISVLADLPGLNYVGLENDRVTDLTPLVQNRSLANGANVILTEDPIDCTAQAANIQTLTARGVLVSSDCR